MLEHRSVEPSSDIDVVILGIDFARFSKVFSTEKMFFIQKVEIQKIIWKKPLVKAKVLNVFGKCLEMRHRKNQWEYFLCILFCGEVFQM